MVLSLSGEEKRNCKTCIDIKMDKKACQSCINTLLDSIPHKVYQLFELNEMIQAGYKPNLSRKMWKLLVILRQTIEKYRADKMRQEAERAQHG